MRLFLFAPLLLLLGCAGSRGPAPATTDRGPLPPRTELPEAESFDDYWYPHGAEISRYELVQSRYGHRHQGDAVMIFVTEPFAIEPQVKSDDPNAPGAVPVLKLNATRRFNTGVYTYSTMVSVFSPRDRERFPAPLKVTTSVQDWCGQVFAQLNARLEDGRLPAPPTYRLREFSYFQSEGDSDREVGPALLEDGLWNQLRLDPESLPRGDVQLVPGSLYSRFAHRPQAPEAARAVLAAPDEAGLRAYTVTYPELDRTLTIRFRAAFPHLIESWTDRYPPRPGAAPLSTTATRTHSRMLPYWERHDPEDLPLRREIGLPEQY